MKKLFVFFALIFSVGNFFLSVLPVSAQVKQEMDEPCEALEDLSLKDAYILSASIIPAEGDLPEYCLVTGYVLPAIHFAIRMPTENWNGKFLMDGCGGFCGKVELSGYNRKGLKRNYAVSFMDSGHWGRNFMDGSWAYHNRNAERDWAYRAVHETARVSKSVIENFYGRAPEKSYFEGCSTGGRQAIMEARWFPDDFDGIISVAPVIDNFSLSISHLWVLRKNMGADGKEIISSADLKLIAEAVYAACDSIDGVKDGLINDPRACEFDPASLLCEDGENEGCLSAEQVETLKAWYQTPKNSAGEMLYPGGLVLGSEPSWQRITGKKVDIDDGLMAGLTLNFFRYVAFQDDPGESWNITDFDFDTDPPRLEFMAKIINADDPDLENFRARGGKLLIYHGWADVLIQPWTSIDYYEAVEKKIGDRANTQEFLRLFLIPGMTHCGIWEGPGVNGAGYDQLTQLEKWVEEGEAPDYLLTTKFDADGNALWQRPVYLYPLRTVYKGEGDIKSASSYKSKGK